MKLIDSHAHINLDDFKKDFNEVIKRIEEKLEYIINIGYDAKTSKESLELAKKYQFIKATVGIHPHDASTYNSDIENKLYKMSKDDNILAIGEIGLDYYRNLSPRDIQKEVFRKQLDIAREINKPVVIHCRDAYGDTLEILEEYKDIYGVMHSYSGSYETAMKLIDRFYFGISGPVTFKNAKKLKEVVKKIPLERLLVETDCPYLTPTPFRGKRNEPIYVEYIAKEIANIKEISYNNVIEQTNKNTKKLFCIK